MFGRAEKCTCFSVMRTQFRSFAEQISSWCGMILLCNPWPSLIFLVMQNSLFGKNISYKLLLFFKFKYPSPSISGVM